MSVKGGGAVGVEEAVLLLLREGGHGGAGRGGVEALVGQWGSLDDDGAQRPAWLVGAGALFAPFPPWGCWLAKVS